MKKNFLVFIAFVIAAICSCNNSKQGPAIEGDWTDGNQEWKCTISKQEGKLVMRSNDGGVYYLKRESGDSYSTNGGTITLIYSEDPIREGACPGTEKFHWHLTGLESGPIKLLNQKELC